MSRVREARNIYYATYDKDEHTKQAERYLKGMQLITDHLNLNDAIQSNYWQSIAEEHAKFSYKISGIQEKIKEKAKEIQSRTLTKINKIALEQLKNKKLKESQKALQKLRGAYARTLQRILNEQYPDTHFTLAEAHKQLTMARDMVILLMPPPEKLITSSAYIGQYKPIEKGGSIFLKIGNVDEQTQLLNISAKYYDTHVFTNDAYASAKKFGGFKPETNNSWIENFFGNPENQARLKEHGHSATPSSRWLPLPGNVRKYAVEVSYSDEKKTGTSISIIAMGTTTAFDYNKRSQKVLAAAQLQEVYDQNIEESIKEYKNLYGDYADNTFYFNYQTLLSPVPTDKAYGRYTVKDNNTQFIEMAKVAMSEIKQEKKLEEKLEEKKSNLNPITIHCVQTNAAINNLAPVTKSYPEDRKHRLDKIKSTGTLLQIIINKNENKSLVELSILKSYLADEQNISATPMHLEKAITELNKIELEADPKLKAEIILRMQASFALKQLLDDKQPYSNLNSYQRNLMMSALETLSQGKQSLAIAGCKSARDRTAIYLSAVKTMMIDPEAMSNWVILQEGITTSLINGHHFQAMAYHCGTVKASDVHKKFHAMLPKDMQVFIESTKEFVKTPKKEGILAQTFDLMDQHYNKQDWIKAILGIPHQPLTPFGKFCVALAIPINLLIKSPIKCFVEMPLKALETLIGIPSKKVKLSRPDTWLRWTLGEVFGISASLVRYACSFNPTQAAKECSDSNARPALFFGAIGNLLGSRKAGLFVGKMLGGFFGGVFSVTGITATCLLGPWGLISAVGAISPAVGATLASALSVGVGSSSSFISGVLSQIGLSAAPTVGVAWTSIAALSSATVETMKESDLIKKTENIKGPILLPPNTPPPPPSFTGSNRSIKDGLGASSELTATDPSTPTVAASKKQDYQEQNTVGPPKRPSNTEEIQAGFLARLEFK